MGGGSRPPRLRPRLRTQGQRLSPGASCPVRGPAGPSATGICGWDTAQAPPGPPAASSACRGRYRPGHQPDLSTAGRFLQRLPSLFPLPGSAGSPYKRGVSDPRLFVSVDLSWGPRVTGKSKSASFCSFGPR
ncbi:hypothetical protein NDU88_000272 [Pleurodeles waltl]|uniref:Uncharacterized protein n=1 Tax=Pleurodeles waltl TaxID=8319 RepID=A0AAV7VXX0_PLEWA|nr:hypothetical protein NDU88_000272 [Pleurodeles waltl]